MFGIQSSVLFERAAEVLVDGWLATSEESNGEQEGEAIEEGLPKAHRSPHCFLGLLLSPLPRNL